MSEGGVAEETADRRQCLKSQPRSRVGKLDLGADEFYVEIIGLRLKSWLSWGPGLDDPLHILIMVNIMYREI